jgi:hypothetical protein
MGDHGEMVDASGTATRTVSSKHVIKQYQRAGHDIGSLAGIQQLDLSAVDAVAKLSRIRYGRSVLAAASGLGSAAVVTGGELLAGAGTVAGAGAGAAPGLGTVAAAVLADTAGVLGLAARSVAATALYYGYDPHRPEEEIFMLSVIGLGMASGTTAKTAAYAEVSQLTQLWAPASTSGSSTRSQSPPTMPTANASSSRSPEGSSPAPSMRPRPQLPTMT